ncbi:MAG: class E sortase [Actinomycetes bacterium]
MGLRHRAGRLALRHRGIVVALLAVVMVAGVAWQASADNSLPAPGWAVSATPTTGLLDGDTVTVNIKANPDVTVYRISVRECRLGSTYAVEADVSARAGNCPLSPVSSSGDLVAGKTAANGLISTARSADGADVTYRVGTGTTNWDTPSGSATLTCDITTQCGLVVLLEIGPDVLFHVFALTFTDADPIVACGGLATGRLQAASSDELADAWANWTRDFCATTGSLAPTTNAFTGEGSAVNGFLGQGVDVAYGSAGLDPANGMITPGTGTRNTVAVPIALDAAVLAVGGGKRRIVDGNPADKLPYPQLQVTPAQAAALLGNGISGFQDDRLPYRVSVLAQNPALDGVAYWTGANVLAPSLPLTSVYLLTKYFTTYSPQDWEYRRDNPPSSRGTSASLAAASPPFTDTALITGRPAMGKVALAATLNDPDGPLWVFTDRATAASLKLVPVALQSPGGTNFVGPDTDTMTAAVANLRPDGQGVLQPVFAPMSAAHGLGTPVVDPYPLTFVEYAFVPAEPLVDPTTCAVRDASQTLLVNWLKYVTGPGQSKLSAGLVPLPQSLQDQAAAAIAKVGTAPVTGACAGRTSPGGGAGSAEVPPSSPLPIPSVARPSIASPVAALPVAAAATAATATATAADVAIPAFAGRRLTDPWGGVVALGGIVIMLSLAAWITAGGAAAAGGGAAAAGGARRWRSLAFLWSGVGLASLGLVVFALGPLIAERDQRSLLSDYRVQVRQGSFAGQSLGSGISTVEQAPPRGRPVGIMEIGALKVQDVVVEGATTEATKTGPGHVPGTAGLGQPGNSVVVARRNGFGAPFSGLERLRRGQRIVVTTTQGQSVYEVDGVCTKVVWATAPDPNAPAVASATKTVSGTGDCPTTGKPTGSGATGATEASPATTTTTDPSSTSTTASTPTTTTDPSSTSTTASTPTTTAVGRGSAMAGRAHAVKVAASVPTTAPSPSTSTSTSTSTTTSGTSATTGSAVTTVPVAGDGTAATTTTTGAGGTKGADGAAAGPTEGPVAADVLFGPTKDDRLTLVTSAAAAPWNDSKAVLVTAKLLTKPFEPTLQGTREPEETGFTGDAGVWSSVILALAALAAIVVGSVVLFRRMRFRTAYLLAIAPLLAVTVIAGETIARLLPAWM